MRNKICLKSDFRRVLNVHANFLFSNLFFKIEKRKSATIFVFLEAGKQMAFDTCIITDILEVDLLSVLPGIYNHNVFL